MVKNSYWSIFFLHASALHRSSSSLGNLCIHFKVSFEVLTVTEAEKYHSNLISKWLKTIKRLGRGPTFSFLPKLKVDFSELC